ncbi:group II intron reverse transcriptase/maturase [Ktedonospora formicarum]|uniref:Group II intron reverse transcriptase/maturase n=1 Tax=Ktedonospora formicarum TaxID=2778364 RepID=A0A8J3MYG2_9CHLR|nr:group II intron reverse transcriptase/maturase [Ktedonospora formicarum]GHO47663.1 group II intron reverse transcriptase/maturase [Ktedonospora formicarum]GHO48912.1 group II intron reverse transcriptase/maturase [Ktedonospora formicarum]GHO50683.1 group II intron reverse transcriptase/maturase [Ktedonospora formicarum]GHO50773.1 group II intron reverse transcriptase/maturase [Ktedonospora formicarum]GHO51330.1 group II intron reverse transcriptase/maturase [Ktedonospora formicarum]
MAERKASRIKTSKKANDPESEAWSSIPWRKLEKHCFRIQKRIFRASQQGNQRAVQKLQKLLIKSEAARTLAVRKVTQDNQGKKTAGIDGVKSVKPAQRLDLVKHIHPQQWPEKSPPVRRIHIPKPGKQEKRPLGIPVLSERARQMLVKLALEPEWEAKFEINSYGFRPGRSCHDAIDAIFISIKHKGKFVLDADIAGCFDNINHEELIRKLTTYPQLTQAITTWLKAGAIENEMFVKTEAGTPQGGVISPLLANIALHGLETTITSAYKPKEGIPQVIRYADDFVVLHPTEEGVKKAQTLAIQWLQTIGLELKPSKTKIAHTLKARGGPAGFDFLGFTIRQFPVGKTHTGKNGHGKPLGFKTIIKPEKEKVKRHLRDIQQVVRSLKGAPQEKLIAELNPKIVGWSRYYQTVVSKETYQKCDHLVYQKLRSWAKFRHPHKNTQWRTEKYWKTVGERHWVFGNGELNLKNHRDTVIKRHVKVKGAASPYDGNLVYWSQRIANHSMTKGKLAKLLRKQQGKCRWCELIFREGDLIEIDHIDCNHSNDVLHNLMAIHRHCHDERHARLQKTSINDNDCTTEEPCEVKISSTVLKPSRGGDSSA